MIGLVATVAVFFLASCSDVTQDLSPVSPSGNIEKINSPIDEFNPYPYLQEFAQVEVKSFSSPEAGGIFVELDGVKSTSILRHVYAVLDYGKNVDPSHGEIVFLGSEIKSEFIQIPNHSVIGLKDVRIYTLADADGFVNGQFGYLKEFERLNIADYSIGEGLVKISLQNWNESMSHTFAEVHYKSGSKLVYLRSLSSNNFSMPINNSKSCTGLDIYCMVF